MGQSEKFVSDIADKNFADAKGSLGDSIMSIINNKVDTAKEDIRNNMAIGGNNKDEE